MSDDVSDRNHLRNTHHHIRSSCCHILAFLALDNQCRSHIRRHNRRHNLAWDYKQVGMRHREEYMARARDSGGCQEKGCSMKTCFVVKIARLGVQVLRVDDVLASIPGYHKVYIHEALLFTRA